MKKFLKLKYLYMLLFVIGFCIGYNSVFADSFTVTDHPVIKDWKIDIPADYKYCLYKDTNNSTGKITYKTIYVKSSEVTFDKACYNNYNDNQSRSISFYNNNVLKNVTWYIQQYIYDDTTKETSVVGGITGVPNYTFVPAPSLSDGHTLELLYNNFEIYQDNNFITIQNPINNIQEDSITDINSRIKITYNYNEDFTNCNVNAVLENGAFTDSIYYSNLPPSISGQGLLTKKIFPRERLKFN